MFTSTRLWCTGTAPVRRYLRIFGQPEPPRTIRCQTDTHTWPGLRLPCTTQHDAHRAGGGEDVDAVVLLGDCERGTQVAGAAGQTRVVARRRTSLPTDRDTIDYRRGTHQDTAGDTVRAAHHIGAQVNSVASVHVQVAGRPEHHPVAVRRAAKRVRGRIGPRAVRHAPVRLHLNDQCPYATRLDGGAEQALRGLYRVGLENLGAHSPIVLDRRGLSARPRAALPGGAIVQ